MGATGPPAAAVAFEAVRVGVLGAGGKMGSVLCQAVYDDQDLELVAAVDPAHAGQPVAGGALRIAPELSALTGAGAEVAVDFTAPSAVRANALWCLARGLHVVVGTTGLADSDLAALDESAREHGCGVVVAPNFAIGAVVLMRLAELAAPWFDGVEIIELHHDAKVDAPSGTALATAARIAAASGDWAADPTRQQLIPGARGGAGPAGIHVHSVRLRGLVAHQEVLFGTTGQTLTLRHDSIDRSSFMPGVLLAVKGVSQRPGLTFGLEPFLGW
jgi:4-hydroxy-tetrahydrodipicolinate reductase